MLSTSTFSPLPPEAAAANLGTAVLWREGLPLAVSATCPAPPLCPATTSLQLKSVTDDEAIAGTPLPDLANFAWCSPLGFMRHHAPHTFTPNRETPGSDAKLSDPAVHAFPALLSYFRQGKLDKFFLGATGHSLTTEMDFISAAKFLRPADLIEQLQSIPREFYDLLDRNKAAFLHAAFGGRRVAKTHSQKNRRRPEKEIHLLKVLAILRCNVAREFFQTSAAGQGGQTHAPREVILSSYLIQAP